MSKRTLSAALLCCVTASVLSSPALAGDNKLKARLTGFQEVPAVSTAASGRFEARIDKKAETISYELSYEGLEGDVTQAHIHFGQKGVNGGISAFLCSNLGTPGVQPCPPAGTITGTITPADIIGPTGQGIDPGEFDELVEAIRAGVTYANVHSSKWPGGEIRGQIKSDD